MYEVLVETKWAVKNIHVHVHLLACVAQRNWGRVEKQVFAELVKLLVF
jgi:hypothetical protein